MTPSPNTATVKTGNADGRCRTLYLVDGYDDGGHLLHHCHYAAQLLRMGHRVVELLPDPGKVGPWLAAACPEAQDRLRLRPFTHPRVTSPSWRLRRLIKPLRTWRAAADAVRAAAQDTGWAPDLVFFNWLDDYIVGAARAVGPLLPLVFPWRWSGVYFHPWHLRIPEGPTRDESVAAEAVLRSRGCRAVAVLDRWVAPELGARLGKPVIVFPDETDTDLPAGESVLAGRLRQAAGGRRVIGLLGLLARRKGVMTLLAAARRAGDRPWLFAFMGSLNDGARGTYSAAELREIDAAIAGDYSNVWFHPVRVDDEREFNAVVQDCDVLYAAYDLFAHSSGIVSKAGFFEKPVLVSPGYCMEADVRDYRLGLAVNPDDPEAVLGAVETVLDREAWSRAAGGEPDYARFQSDYSSEALKSAFETLLNIEQRTRNTERTRREWQQNARKSADQR